MVSEPSDYASNTQNSTAVLFAIVELAGDENYSNQLQNQGAVALNHESMAE